MKRYQAYVSLLLLVTLFFLIYPFQTTYAYFTDQTSVNGNLSLKTGTLVLAEMNGSEGVFEKNIQLEVATKIKNMGTLDGKLTIGTIVAKQNNQILANYQEFFGITTNLENPTRLTADDSRDLTVTLNKNKDWDKAKPIILEIPIRISQTNVVGDQSGFIDQKIYRITLTNNSVETPEWPEFKDNGYIAQPLYHSVVDGKLTTVVPGIVYLKSAKPLSDPKAFFENSISIQRNGQPIIKPVVSKVEYIDKKGYRLELIHAENITHHLTDTDTMRFEFIGSDQKLGYNYWGENSFSRAFIMDSELRRNSSFYAVVSKTIEADLLSSSPINRGYTSFNNIGGEKELTEPAKDYIKKHLSIRTTRDSHLKATFITNPIDKAYSGIQLSLENANIQAYKGGKFQLVINGTDKVVFERKVEHAPGKKELLKVESTTETTQESSFETSQTSTSSRQEDSMNFSMSEESETTSTEMTENSTMTEESESTVESIEASQENKISDSMISSEVRLEESVTSSSSEMSSEEELLLKE